MQYASVTLISSIDFGARSLLHVMMILILILLDYNPRFGTVLVSLVYQIC